MHFESIVSKDLEGRLGAKRHSGANHRKGANENVSKDKNVDDLLSTSHDSAKLLSYRAGEMWTDVQEWACYQFWLRRPRQQNGNFNKSRSNSDDYFPEIKFPIGLTIDEFT